MTKLHKYGKVSIDFAIVANSNGQESPEDSTLSIVRTSVVLKFYPNPRYKSDDRLSAHVSCYDGSMVFPKGALPTIISNNNLVGKSLYVTLESRTSNTGTYYDAFPDTAENIVAEGETITPSTRVAIFVDAQNFIGTLFNLRKTRREAFPAHHFLEKIIGHYNFIDVTFFICRQQIQTGNLFTPAEKHALQNHPSIRLEVFDAKTVQNEEKTDADKIIIPELAFSGARAKDENIGGIALISGDSDYARTCRMLAGIGKYARRGYGLPIDIIAGWENISSDLREVGNHPTCRLRFLDDL